MVLISEVLLFLFGDRPIDSNWLEGMCDAVAAQICANLRRDPADHLDAQVIDELEKRGHLSVVLVSNAQKSHYGELLGAHLLGSQVTELIAELVMAKKLEATEEEILHAMHPHPTYSEAVMEAAGQGLGESVHI